MAYRKKSDRGRSLQVYAGGSKSAQPSERVQPPTTPSTRKPVVRVAIYCRKSSEEGLEQQFNSLDAQRASGEAYVQSRRMDGWVCVPERFEDGGISGGTMDRPALMRLLRKLNGLLTTLFHQRITFTREGAKQRVFRESESRGGGDFALRQRPPE